MANSSTPSRRPPKRPLSRRAFLRLAGAGSAAMLAACATPPSTPVPTARPKVDMIIRGATAGFEPDLEFDLRATQASQNVLSGKPTTVWTYQPRLVRGDAASLQTIPSSYLGPVVRARTGQRVRVNFINDLPDLKQESVIHWHGLVLPEDMDGHPRYVIQPRQTYVYEFEIANRAGTYWFHPHPHGRTGPQVYAGLAGLFLVSDDEEQALELPRGEYDVPLVIQDRRLDADNQFVYLTGPIGATGQMMPSGGMGGMDHGGMMGGSGTEQPGGPSMDMGGMMDAMMGFLGDRVLVNGQPDYLLRVATRVYRLRLLNGSNARIYKLGWSTGDALIVIGTDGGLLEKPVEKPYVMLAPGERVELWADFSRLAVGTELTLTSLEFFGAEDPGGMMGSMSTGPALGTPMPIFKVRVERDEPETLALPPTLASLTRLKADEAVNAASPRPLAISLKNMTWLLNGQQFEMTGATADETVQANTLEVWEIVNQLNPGEMMDANGMAHPIHLHGVQFQVVDREVLSQLKAGWETVSQGYTDEGWKDTVLVMPGERVKLAMRFADHPGLFVYHCHNLEHEDQGMMRNYRVQA